MPPPLQTMIDRVMRCVACGAPMGGCDCWERCSCGWYADRGRPCRNPETRACSTKVKYGKYSRKTKRYE